MNAAPSITTTTLATATQTQVGYSQTVAGTGGTTPYAWSVSSGILPSGLTINAATGVISGTVGGSAVSETFTVKVVDTNGVAATKSLTITVNAAPSLRPGTLAGATQGGSYSQTLASLREALPPACWA